MTYLNRSIQIYNSNPLPDNNISFRLPSCIEKTHTTHGQAGYQNRSLRANPAAHQVSPRPAAIRYNTRLRPGQGIRGPSSRRISGVHGPFHGLDLAFYSSHNVGVPACSCMFRKG